MIFIYCVIKNSFLRCIQPFPNYNEDIMPQPCNGVIKYKGNAISKYSVRLFIHENLYATKYRCYINSAHTLRRADNSDIDFA